MIDLTNPLERLKLFVENCSPDHTIIMYTGEQIKVGDIARALNVIAAAEQMIKYQSGWQTLIDALRKMKKTDQIIDMQLALNHGD